MRRVVGRARRLFFRVFIYRHRLHIQSVATQWAGLGGGRSVRPGERGESAVCPQCAVVRSRRRREKPIPRVLARQESAYDNRDDWYERVQRETGGAIAGGAPLTEVHTASRSEKSTRRNRAEYVTEYTGRSCAVNGALRVSFQSPHRPSLSVVRSSVCRRPESTMRQRWNALILIASPTIIVVPSSWSLSPAITLGLRPPEELLTRHFLVRFFDFGLSWRWLLFWW